MSFNLTSPVTGSPQTGLTSPTFTVAVDTPPNANSKQWAVTVLGGTQAGVTANTVSSPFTITGVRPATLRSLGSPNPITGVVSNVPFNVYKVITRKGVVPLAGQAPVVMNITTTVSVPAGADTADMASIRSAFSAHIGALDQQSAGLGDLANNGIL